MSLSFGSWRRRRRRLLAIAATVSSLLAAYLFLLRPDLRWQAATPAAGGPRQVTAQASRTPATPTRVDPARATPSPGHAPVGAPLGPLPKRLPPSPPLLSMGRPFIGPDLGQKASPNYLYGSTGGGEYILHHGLDFSNPLGSRIAAVADGEVVFTGEDRSGPPFGPPKGRFPEGFYGRLVVLRHQPEDAGATPLYSLYAHVNRVLVRRRQRVREGQGIAEVGMAGIALGPHLHLEIRDALQDYGRTYNPYLFLKPLPGEGLIIGRVSDPAGRALAKVPVNLFRLAEGGAPDWWTATTTYPAEPVRPYPGIDENFVFADLPAGRYRVVAQTGGGPLQTDLEVGDGEATALLLQRQLP